MRVYTRNLPYYGFCSYIFPFFYQTEIIIDFEEEILVVIQEIVMATNRWRTRVLSIVQKIACFVVTMCVVGGVTLVAMESQRRGGPAREMGRGGIGRLVMIPLRKLDLSRSQLVQIRSVVKPNHSALRETLERVRVARKALYETMKNDWVDAQEIRMLAENLGVLEGETAVARAQLRGQVWQLLTHGQKAKAEALEDDWMRERQERRRGQR